MIHLLLEELAQLLRLMLHRLIKSDRLTGVTDDDIYLAKKPGYQKGHKPINAQLVDVPMDCRPVDNCEYDAKTDGLLRRLKGDKKPQLISNKKIWSET